MKSILSIYWTDTQAGTTLWVAVFFATAWPERQRLLFHHPAKTDCRFPSFENPKWPLSNHKKRLLSQATRWAKVEMQAGPPMPGSAILQARCGYRRFRGSRYVGLQARRLEPFDESGNEIVARRALPEHNSGCGRNGEGRAFALRNTHAHTSLRSSIVCMRYGAISSRAGDLRSGPGSADYAGYLP